MDPNEALKLMREAITRVRNAESALSSFGHDEIIGLGSDLGPWIAAAGDVVELADALDRWVTSAGYLPDSWARPDHQC